MTIWQRVRRITAWGLYLTVLAGISAALWQLVIRSYDAYAVLTLLAGLALLLLLAPRRAPERIPAQGK